MYCICVILEYLQSVEHLRVKLPAVAPALLWVLDLYKNTGNYNSSASLAHRHNINNIYFSKPYATAEMCFRCFRCTV